MSQVVFNNMLITDSMSSIEKSIRELTLIQKRIYKATLNNDYGTVHKLQKLLFKSQSIKLIILLKVMCNCYKYSKYQNLVFDSKIQLEKVHTFNEIKFAELQTLLIGINSLDLRKFFSDHVSISNLKYKLQSYLIYLCLQPEWAAKLNNYTTFNTNAYNISNKINLTLQIYKQYQCLKKHEKKNSHIYLLKICVLKKIQNIYCPYLIRKLNTITVIRKLIEDCFVSTKQKKDLKYLSLNFMNINLQYLLKAIIIEEISSQIQLYNTELISIKNTDKIKLKLSRFVWHIDSILFFSKSKQEIVLIQYLITKSIDKIGLKYHYHDFVTLNATNGFRFEGFYFKPQLQRIVTIQPSFRYQLILLKKIKTLLYHKDRFYRIRANSYLSFSSAVYKINLLIIQWRGYYAQLKTTKLDSRIKTSIQKILYRWKDKVTSKRLIRICSSSQDLH